MTFEEYLSTKKIDSALFKSAEPERWQEWASLFTQMSPVSFTSQKLYLINPVRRNYPTIIRNPQGDLQKKTG